MMAISLNIVNHSLPSGYMAPIDEVLLGSLRLLSDEIGATFFELQSNEFSVIPD